MSKSLSRLESPIILANGFICIRYFRLCRLGDPPRFTSVQDIIQYDRYYVVYAIACVSQASEFHNSSSVLTLSILT